MRLLAALTALAALVLASAMPAPAGAVVGGRAASQPYPHMTALLYDFAGDDAGHQFVCGASLVRPDWILTAAHCVVDDRDGDGPGKDAVVPPETVRFKVGSQRLDVPDGETLQAVQVVVHERYLEDPDSKPHRDAFDVALVRVATPSQLGAPIRVATPGERAAWRPGATSRVIGWGARTGFDMAGLTVSNQLQEVDLTVRSDRECDSYNVFTGGIDAPTMVCAGEMTGGRDSCQGDSGGPLMARDAAGALAQFGVVSFGFGCGYPTQYGVYSEVGETALHAWVQGKLPAEGAPPAPVGGAGTSTGTSPGTAAPPPATGTRRRSTAYSRCAARASRVRGLSARRRAGARCVRAERRRAAYRRCVARARTTRAKRRCTAVRRASARRDARVIRRLR